MAHLDGTRSAHERNPFFGRKIAPTLAKRPWSWIRVRPDIFLDLLFLDHKRQRPWLVCAAVLSRSLFCSVGMGVRPDATTTAFHCSRRQMERDARSCEAPTLTRRFGVAQLCAQSVFRARSRRRLGRLGMDAGLAH